VFKKIKVHPSTIVHQDFNDEYSSCLVNGIMRIKQAKRGCENLDNHFPKVTYVVGKSRGRILAGMRTCHGL
jgi:hypothetical protein